MGYCITKSGPIPYENRAVCEGPGVNGTFYTDSEYKAREEQLRRMDTLDKDTDAYQYGTGSLAENERELKNRINENTGEYDPSMGVGGYASLDSLGSLPFVGGLFGGGEVNKPQAMPFGTLNNQGISPRPIQHTPNTGDIFNQALTLAGKTPSDFSEMSDQHKNNIRRLIALQMAKSNELPDGSGDTQGHWGDVTYPGFKDSKGFKHIYGHPEIVNPKDLTTPYSNFRANDPSTYRSNMPNGNSLLTGAQADLKKAMDAKATMDAQNKKPGDTIKTKPKELSWMDRLMQATPGGSGGWDNPMYRIGELMREMDAPGSWGLDGRASDRWSTAAAAEAKNTALTGKNAMAAQAKIDEKEIDRLLSYAKTNPSHLAKAVAEYLPEELNERWFGRDFTTEQKESLSHQIALTASDAMFQASLDGQFIPISVALKLAAQQLVKEKKKKENNNG